MQALGTKILIRRAAPVEQRKSIILPEKARVPSQTGFVHSVGSEVTTVLPGDVVVFQIVNSDAEIEGLDGKVLLECVDVEACMCKMSLAMARSLGVQFTDEDMDLGSLLAKAHVK